MSTVLGTRIGFEEAVAEAVRMEMRRDPDVVLVSGPGGDGVATEVSKLFGHERTIETRAVGAPLVVAAAGAAAEGLRPVCELGPGDAGAPTLDQITEVAALHSADGREPAALCIRLSCGDPFAGGGAAGANPLTWLIGVAGLKVVCPTTPADAKGLTAAAIRDPEPVCVIQDVRTRGLDGMVPEGGHVVEIGRARLVSVGESLTVIAHGAAVAEAEAAIAEQRIDADLIDLRSLQPLDTEAVLTSVRRTGRVVFVEPDAGARRVTAELVSAIWECAFEYLDAPPRRVRLRSTNRSTGDGGADVPAPALAEIKEVCNECLAY